MEPRKHWRRIAGGVLIVGSVLGPALRGINSVLQWAQNIDFLWSHAGFFLAWGNAILDALLNPPSWLSVFVALVGLALIYWDSRKRRGEIVNLPTIQSGIVPSGGDKTWPRQRYTGIA